MRHLLFSLFAVAGLLHSATALPQPQGGTPAMEAQIHGDTPANPPSPSPSPSPGDKFSTTAAPPAKESGYGDNQVSRDNGCVIFSPPNGPATLSMCQNVCGDAVAKQIAAGHTGSISCISFFPSGTPDPSTMEGGVKLTPGNCTCNEPLLDQLADTYVNALPIIAEIGCNLMISVFTKVIEIGALAIPGVGEAVDGAMIAGISAAKLASYAYDAGSAGFGAFSMWANPCGKSPGMPKDLQKAFNILNAANPMIIPKGGFKPPAGIKPGSELPKGSDKNPPKEDPPKENPPKPSPKPTEKPIPSDKSEPSEKPTSKDEACGKLNKRVDDKKGKGKECGHDITSMYIADGKSTAKPKVILQTCTARLYPQPCYHYYSVSILDQYKMSSTFACSNSNEGARARADLTAVSDWKKQHTTGHGWDDYVYKGYKWKEYPDGDPNCQADEYPPSYFRSGKNTGQLIRYLPGGENMRTAQKGWTNFCNKNDGGEGNGQYKKKKDDKDLNEDRSINTELVINPKSIGHKTERNKGTTTSHITYEADYQQAVFSMTFEWAGVPEPNEKNNFGLEMNPCWPQAILPNDPGFALLTSDPWYTKLGHVPNPDTRPQYSKQPTDDMRKAADVWNKNNPGGPGDKHGANTPPAVPDDAKNKKPNPPGGGHKRDLEMLDDGLAIRELNTTRRLTDEEVKRDVKVINCADRECSKERRAYAMDDNAILVIPGAPPLTVPSTNVDTLPTIKPRAAATMEIKMRKRSAASPQLPEATPSPLNST